jgi:hypothetical protein
MTSGTHLRDQGVIAVEVRIITAKEETFQSVGLEQNFAGHPLSVHPKIIDEPVNDPGNIAVYHPVGLCPFSV